MALPPTLAPAGGTPAQVPYRRIATEEAWCPPAMLDLYNDILKAGTLDDPGFMTMFGFYMNSTSKRSRDIRDYLVDLGPQRLAHMDERGIDMQVLSLTSPGVQVFERDLAVSFAAESNDILADAITKHPTRYTGLAAIAPQDPAAAAKELERSITKLGLSGGVINSHTFGEYLDDRKFWPIFEAAEALDTPIYLHPQVPPRGLVEKLLERGLDGAIYGFSVETAMHMLRIMISGALDRFPKLQFILGHGGEALPFWMYRLDYMHRAGVVSKRYESMPPTDRPISQYLRENVCVTSSGMAWSPAITFCQQVLGVDRVMYAMDYPYQHGVEEVIASDGFDMPDADKHAFFQGNAERVFKLKG
jgi:5-carboxyvanillate decarboxylase